MSVLRVEGLVKSYGRRRVVDGVSYEVRPAEIVGLLGPNGAGKTTSFRMTCGMAVPDQGRVYLNDIDVTDWPMYRRARDGGMGYLAQESSVFRKLTVEQNLLAMLELLGVKRKARRQRCQTLLEQFDIVHIRKSRAAKLSGGERRRLEIARCLVSDPEIIMLDEPFAGIDPVTVQSIQTIIRDLRDQGISILITDHAAREILEIVDRCYVISEGQVLCSGTSDEIKSHDEVRRKYLGDIDGPQSIPRPHVAVETAAIETAAAVERAAAEAITANRVPVKSRTPVKSAAVKSPPAETASVDSGDSFSGRLRRVMRRRG